MANILNNAVSNVICGLGSYSYSAEKNSMYSVSIRCTENVVSNIILTISQSGSATSSISSLLPGVDQMHIELRTVLNCQVGDVITVTISSALSIDNQLNTVTTIVNLHRI